MPFGLKNARVVDTIFEGQICRNLEAYVDDMVIKSKTEQDLIRDIEETLLTLKKVNMKLNPKTYSFGMEEGKFLGYIKQIPIHYVSRSLQGAEINYALMEKLALALVHATRRLRSLLTQASDEELEELMKDQPLSADASPTALSPGYIADSNPEEDKEDPEEDPADHPADG
ncbi:reverse transcriptase domain-containing protein [Tanacetum coccineum]